MGFIAVSLPTRESGHRRPQVVLGVMAVGFPYYLLGAAEHTGNVID